MREIVMYIFIKTPTPDYLKKHIFPWCINAR